MGLCEDLEKAKHIANERVTVDTEVTGSPALIYSLTLCSDGGGIADAVVYDGGSNKGDRKIDLRVIDDDMRPLFFDPPLYFARGIYVDVGSNVESVLIQYHPIRE